MGGWGKLSVSSTVLHVAGLPIPMVAADSIVLRGLFARGKGGKPTSVSAIEQGGDGRATLSKRLKIETIEV